MGHPIVTNVILRVRGGDAALPKLLWDFLLSVVVVYSLFTAVYLCRGLCEIGPCTVYYLANKFRLRTQTENIVTGTFVLQFMRSFNSSNPGSSIYTTLFVIIITCVG